MKEIDLTQGIEYVVNQGNSQQKPTQQRVYMTTDSDEFVSSQGTNKKKKVKKILAGLTAAAGIITAGYFAIRRGKVSVEDVERTVQEAANRAGVSEEVSAATKGAGEVVQEVVSGIKSLKASLVTDDADLRQVQEIDLASFKGKYEIDEDFTRYKANLEEQKVSTYAIKDESGKVVGYYQLEPAENSELYIHSIAVRPELQKTKTSFAAIMEMQKEIAKLAKEQNLTKVALDVDADDQVLVKLYKKFGFEITGEETGTEAGRRYRDYHMELDVDSALKKLEAKEQPKAEVGKVETPEAEAVKTETPEVSQPKSEPVKSEVAEEVAKPKRSVRNVGNFEASYMTRPTVQGLVYEKPRYFKLDGYYHSTLKPYKLDGKTYVDFYGSRYQVIETSDVEYVTRHTADELYRQVGFDTPEVIKFETEATDSVGYLRKVNLEPKTDGNFLERIIHNEGMNIFTDEVRIIEDGVFAISRGDKAVMVKIVDDVTSQPAQKGVYYVTPQEFVDITSAFEKVSLNKFMSSSDVTSECRVNNKHFAAFEKELVALEDNINALRHQMVQVKGRLVDDGSAFSSVDKYRHLRSSIEAGKAQYIEEIKAKVANKDDVLERFLAEKIEDSASLSSWDKEKKEFREAIINNLQQSPRLRPYIINLLDNYNYDARQLLEKLCPKYGVADEDRLVVLTKLQSIRKPDPNSTWAKLPVNSFESLMKLSDIPTEKLLKYVFVDGIESADEIVRLVNQNFVSKIKTLNLGKTFNLDEKIETDIVKNLLDEFGEISIEKYNIAYELMRKNSEFTKHYSSFCTTGPFTLVSELMEKCQTPEDIKALTQYLSEMEKVSGYCFEKDIMVKEFNMYLKAKDKQAFIEKVKQLRINTDHNDQKLDDAYLEKLMKSFNPQIIRLQEYLADRGFDGYLVNNIIREARVKYNSTVYNEDFVKIVAEILENLPDNIDKNTVFNKIRYTINKAVHDGDFSEIRAKLDKIACFEDILENPLRDASKINQEKLLDQLMCLDEKGTKRFIDIMYDKALGEKQLVFSTDIYSQDGDMSSIAKIVTDEDLYKRYMTEFRPLLLKHDKGVMFRNPYSIECTLKEMIKRPVGEFTQDMEFFISKGYEGRDLRVFAQFTLEEIQKIKGGIIYLTRKNKGLDPYVLEHLSDLNPSEYNEFVTKVYPRIDVLWDSNYVNNSYITNYLGLSVKELDTLTETCKFLRENLAKLQHADMKVTDSNVCELINSNIRTILNVVDSVGQDVFNHAIERRYKGLKDLLEVCSKLESLRTGSPETLKLLSDQLGKLPHPEQKLKYLETVSSLVDLVKVDELEGVIRAIKPQDITKNQIIKLNQVFSTQKSYEQQIEDFIREFKVPENKKERIRALFERLRVDEKFTAPKPIEEQIKILDIKAQKVLENDKIPADKKQEYLAQIERQKQKMLANPEEYTTPRINEPTMKTLIPQIEAHINLPNNNYEISRKLNELLFKSLKFEVTSDELYKIDFDSKYFSKLLSTTQESFKTEFKELLNLLQKYPGKTLTEIMETLPENKKTRELFAKFGLDYDKWVKFNDEFYESFVVKVDAKAAIKQARNNLLEEFVSDSVKDLDPKEVEKLAELLEKLKEENYSKKALARAIKAIEEAMKDSDYWKQETEAISNFKSHIQIHKRNIKEALDLVDMEEELHVRLWNNDDIGRNIFFGNHVGCCTKVTDWNAYSVPQHLRYSWINGIEIVDKAGNSLGNSMCYFAEVDGKLTFIIDSFEANGKLNASEDVTRSIIAFGRKLCKELGREDAAVVFGPNYNKLKLHDVTLKTKDHTIKIVGQAPSCNTYVDALGGTVNANNTAVNRELFEIIEG